jgi:hypothetical protein
MKSLRQIGSARLTEQQRLCPRPEERAPLNERLGLADVCGIIIDPPYGHSTPHALGGLFFAHSRAQRFK